MIPFSDPIGYLAAPLLSAVLLFGSAYLLGSRITAWLRLPLIGVEERLAIPAAVGLATLGLAGAALGAAGGFRPALTLSLLALPALLGVPARRGAGRPREPPGGGRAIRMAAHGLVAVLAAVNLLAALHPPTGFDALNYQLPAVARYLEEGSLVFPADLRFAAGPALVPVLFVLAAASGGELAAQLVSFGLGLLAALMVGAVARRAFGSTAAAAATAVFYATPVVGWLSAEAYVDLGLALFATAALHAVLVRLQGGGLAWTAAGGLAAGAALGTRYLAVLPLGVLAVDLLTAPAAETAAGPRRRLAGAAILLAVAAAVSAPWLVRNQIESGNPVFPLFNDRLGGAYWTAADVEAHRAYLAEVGPGRGSRDLLLLPLRLTADPAAFGGSTTTGVGYAYLILVPAGLVRMRRSRAGPALLAYGLLLGAAWFATSQQTRFLLPTLAALAVFAGLAVAPAGPGVASRNLVPFLALAIAALGGARWPGALPPAGEAARGAWLRDHLGGYARVEQVNEHLPRDAVLYAFGQEGLRYYFEARTLGDWFGPTAFRAFLPGEADRPVWTGWRRLGVSHVLIDDRFPSRAIRAFRERPFWWDRLIPLASWEGLRLYRLRPPPDERREARLLPFPPPSGRS